MEKYWVIDEKTYLKVLEMLSNKFKPFIDFTNYIAYAETLLSYNLRVDNGIDVDFNRYEMLFLYFSVFEHITLNKEDTDNICCTENLIKKQIQYLQTISPNPIDSLQEDKLVDLICKILRYSYPGDTLTAYEKWLYKIEHYYSTCEELNIEECTLEEFKEKICLKNEDDYYKGFEKHKNTIIEYIDWLKKGNTGIAAEIEKIINETSFKRIPDIKIEYLRIKDIIHALEHVDEKDLNVLDRFLSSVIINAPGDAAERNEQLKKLKQQIEHCKQTHKHNNTPVLTIQNAQQVIDNQNGIITIKK